MNQPGHQALAGVVQPLAEGVAVRVKVVPGASRSRLAGVLGDRLKLQVAAPPERGKANGAVCELLADALAVPAAAARVAQGLTRPHKTVAVTGVDMAEALARLARALR